jgi:predicted permease
METLLRDLRHGLRGLALRPGFTLGAVLSLALAIGSNTAIFTVVKAVFLKSLPVREPERLVRIFSSAEGSSDLQDVSHPNFAELARQARSFAGLAVDTPTILGLSVGGDAELLHGEMVSGNYFDLLGVRAELGRTFLPEEDLTPNSHPVVVLSHDLWQRRFGGDRGVLGRPVKLDGRELVVIGVAPRGFTGTAGINPCDFWIPRMMYELALGRRMAPFFDERRATLFGIIGRLKDGVTMEQGQAEAALMAQSLARDYPEENEGKGLVLLPLLRAQVDPNQRGGYVKAGVLLSSVVAMVLLVACANLANMLLARANRRRRETAVRLALGARRGQLVRQLLVESLVLALISAGVGLLLASWSRSLLTRLQTPYLPAGLDLGLDARVLLFTLGLSVLTALLFGLIPALQSSRPGLVSAIKGEELGGPRRGWGAGVRGLLVVAQVSLSLVALIGAALFVLSVRNAQKVELGFESDHLLAASFDLDTRGYDATRGRQALAAIVERARALPGVRSAAVAETLVLAGRGFPRTINVEGWVQKPGERLVIHPNSVDPGYFETMGIPLLRGRLLTAQDRDGSPRVAVINRTMADRYWNGDAVGGRFKLAATGETLEVIGVVRDVKYTGVDEKPRNAVYFPISQVYTGAVTLHVRTGGEPALLAGLVRQVIQSVEPGLPLLDRRTMPQVLDALFWVPRTGAALLGLFGLLTLVLVVIGIYAIMSYAVAERRREIGIRLALGAGRSRVVLLLFRESMALVVAGVVLGLASAFLLSPLVSSLLFGVGARSVLPYLAAALLISLVAALATYIPARRVTAISPMIVMRQE